MIKNFYYKFALLIVFIKSSVRLLWETKTTTLCKLWSEEVSKLLIYVWNRVKHSYTGGRATGFLKNLDAGTKKRIKF